MNAGKTLFAQVMEFVPWTSFARIVARYSGDARVSTLRSAEHFRIMAYAQLTWRESLRDIEVTLSANAAKLYAMGLRNAVRRTTLADQRAARLAYLGRSGCGSDSPRQPSLRGRAAWVGGPHSRQGLCP